MVSHEETSKTSEIKKKNGKTLNFEFIAEIRMILEIVLFCIATVVGDALLIVVGCDWLQIGAETRFSY